MAKPRDLVHDVIADACAWPPGSFAVFAAAHEPSWYVQFAVDAPGELVVEVANPEVFGGPTYSHEQVQLIQGLEFAATSENFAREMLFATSEERDVVRRTLTFVLTEVFGLADAGDVTLDFEGASTPSPPEPGVAASTVDAAESFDALMRGELGGGVTADQWDSRPVRAWFDHMRDKDDNPREALKAALASPGPPDAYLEVLARAFVEFSEWRRTRSDVGWLVEAERVAQKMLALAELARKYDWKLEIPYGASGLAMFYAREGLLHEARRAQRAFGVDEYSREEYDRRISAGEAAG